MITEEHNIQSQCVSWYKLEHPDLIIAAVPNAGKRTPASLHYLKDEGFCKGFADLIVMNINKQLVLVEMKTETGKLSPEQKELKAKCEHIRKGLYYVCRSLEEFEKIVNCEI